MRVKFFYVSALALLATTVSAQLQENIETSLNSTVWELAADQNYVVFETPWGRDLAPWTTVDVRSSRNWYGVQTPDGGTIASCNGYRADNDEPSDDWLISPKIVIAPDQRATFQFETKKGFDGPDIQVWLLQDPGDHVTDPSSYTVEELTSQLVLSIRGRWTHSGILTFPGAETKTNGSEFRIGIRYVSTGGRSGQSARWEVRNPVISLETAQVSPPRFVTPEPEYPELIPDPLDPGYKAGSEAAPMPEESPTEEKLVEGQPDESDDSTDDSSDTRRILPRGPRGK